MAKKTGFEKFLEDTPRRAEFSIDMVADSQNEVWADIDTGIDDGQAWIIYGMEYGFENVDPTVPLAIVQATSATMQIQVHRNDDSEIMLAMNNDLLMAHHKVSYVIDTEGASTFTEPFKVPINNTTLQPTLRVMFRSAADMVEISAATARLSGVLLYDVMSAPARLSSKIGTLTDL